MVVVEEFESCSERSRRLLEDMSALNGQDISRGLTPEWMKRVQSIVDRTGKLMAHSGFTEIKATQQIHQYRSELLRLKHTMERSQQQLLLDRKAIEKEQRRLKQVQELAGTLQTIG